MIINLLTKKTMVTKQTCNLNLEIGLLKTLNEYRFKLIANLKKDITLSLLVNAMLKYSLPAIDEITREWK